jgi:hypothetical protein
MVARFKKAQKFSALTLPSLRNQYSLADFAAQSALEKAAILRA